MSPGLQGNHNRRRGRPLIPWTPHRQRRLLRLYLLTPQSELSLDDILTLLKEDGFTPAKRRAQQEMRRLLSEQYQRLRPKDRSVSQRRGTCLKSVGFRASPRQSFPGPMIKTTQRYQRPTSIASAAVDRPPHSSPMNESTVSPGDDATHASIEQTALENRHQQRKSLIRRILSSQYTPSRASEIASFLSLSPRSSFRTSLASSLRSLAARSSLTSVSGLNKKPSLWSTLRTRAEPINVSQPIIAEMRAEPQVSDLEAETHANAAANSALLAECCGRYGQLISKAGCIHQQLHLAIAQNKKLDMKTLPVLTEELIIKADGVGDSLLHVAARWGAQLTTLIDLVRVMPAQSASILNQDRETFMHILDPQVIKSTETFAILIAMLRTKAFDFCQLDRRRRTFITRLVRRPGLPWKALAYLLETASTTEVHFWTTHKPRGDPGNLLRRSILHKQREDSGNALGPALQCQYLLHRSSIDIEPGYTTCRAYSGGKLAFRLPTTAHVDELYPLHRLIGSMNLCSEWNLTHFPDIELAWTGWDSLVVFGAGQFDAALQWILKSLPGELSIDTADADTGQSPLMTLLVGFGGRLAHPSAPKAPLSDSVQTRCVHVLLDAGASLACSDHQGNTALHYAAALGLKDIVKVLIEHGARADRTNHHGFTSAQLAASSLKYMMDTDKPRIADAHGRFYECISMLIQ